MLKYLQNYEIDFLSWDECISRSPQNLIYAMSWYMDIVAPGWCAIVQEEKGKYTFVIPIPVKSKLAIKYIFQPIFSQQLGMFSLKEKDENIELALQFLKHKFLHINYNFNIYNTEALGNSIFAPHLRKRTTYMLMLNETYQQLTERYATNNKRNIKKALRNGLFVKPSDDFSTLVELFRKMKGLELSAIKNIHYQNLSAIFLAAKNRGNYILYNAVDKSNNILAGGFFLMFQKKIIYVLGASSEEGKEKGAMNLIIDEIIKEYAEGEYILDFEGGEVEGIGRFYKGFGGMPHTYLTLTYNKLLFK